MKQLSHLLMTVILVASCGDASRASAKGEPQDLVADGSATATPNLGDLLVHVVSPITGTKILPSTYPLPGKKSFSLRVAASRGEFEPISFVLRAQSRDMNEVKLTATDLHSANRSAVISSTHVDLKIVKPWFQSYYAWNEMGIGKSDPPDFRQNLVPELLLKDDALVQVDMSTEQNFVRLDRGSPVYEWINQKKLAVSKQILPTMQEFPIKDAKTLQPFALPMNTSKQVWATIFVPMDTPPGEYSGDIEVRSNGALQGTIKIEIKVHSFELAESNIIHSIYYRAVLDDVRASVGSEYRNAQQMREELRNLLNHGVRNPTMYQPFLSGRGHLREALQLRLALGMNNAPLYYIGTQTTASSLGTDSTKAEEKLKTVFSQVKGIAREYGFTSVYIYGKDEAKGGELLAQRRLWNIVHGLGGKVFVAGFTDSFELVGDSLDLLVHAHQPSAHEATKWQGSGHKIFNYANPQTGPENPFLLRLNYGIVLWANGYDGAMPYAYQHCFGACWNDVDHPKYRDHNLTYPTADGVIDTLAWEGFREAVDDLRYLTTLEKLLSNVSANTTPAVDQARVFLSTLKTAVLSKQTRSGKYNVNMDINLDAVRDQIVGHIDAITNER
ncbi:MAG: hypothetical protein ABIU05_08090 [Nitrospirales bacterium]